MGIIKQGILGPVSGKVGSVIGGTWKGIAYVRGIAPSYTNPQTPGQLAQRQKFSLMIGVLKDFAAFLAVGFKNYAVGMTEINASMAYNMDHAIGGVYPDQTVTYANLRVSQGTLPSALNGAAASTVPATIAVTWDDNSTEIGAAATDPAIILAYNPTLHQGVSSDGAATRTDGTLALAVPAGWSTQSVHVYLGFKNAAGNVANSAYCGAVTVA